jgi:S1-C subfamily serine protease
VQTRRTATRHAWLAAFGVVLALGSASQALRSVDAHVLDVEQVSDPISVSAVGARVPVVRITARTCGGLEAGSGFVLAGGLVITAAHVVQGALTATVDLEGGGSVPASVIGVDGTGRDVAVLFVPALIDAPGASVTTRAVARGAEVSTSGHPFGGVRQTLAGRVIDYVDSGPIAADGGRVITVSAAFVPGMSGGPVVDLAGHVVGVAIGVERTTGTGIAIPTSELAATLRGEALSPAPSCAAGR